MLKSATCQSTLHLQNTFNILTLPKMRYCGEFCFHSDIKRLKWIEYQFYKRYYQFVTATTNYTIIGEFSIAAIECHFYKSTNNYWIKIITMNDWNLLKQFYNEIFMNIGKQVYQYLWSFRIRKLMKADPILDRSKKH